MWGNIVISSANRDCGGDRIALAGGRIVSEVVGLDQ